MLALECDKSAGYVEITLDSGINVEEYQSVITAIDDAPKTHDKLNLVGVLRDFGHVEWSVWPKDFVFHATHRDWMKHVAIVSDMGWVAPTMQIFAPFFAAEIRCFSAAKLDEARAWARTGSITRAVD